jgi:predicted NBD/HSP70 family sugar kinase
MVNDLLTRHGLSRRALLGAGVGLPGAFTATAGEGAKHASFAVWHQPSVLKALERDLDVAVFLENNAKAAALGERWYGRGQTINNFLYVSLGRYLGGAVVINGQIHRGSTGLAGELGDIPVVSAASLGKELADYASPAVLYEALASCGEVVTSPAELQALFNQGHPYILEWLITAAQHLAPTLIVAEYLFDPEAIIFGGRLPPLLLDELIARLEGVMSRYRNKTKQHSPPLIRSDAGEIAAALGAATLPIYDFMAPHPSVLLKQPAGQRLSSAVLTD